MRCAYPTYKLIRPVYPGKYICYSAFSLNVGFCLKVFTEPFVNLFCRMALRLSDLRGYGALIFNSIRYNALNRIRIPKSSAIL